MERVGRESGERGRERAALLVGLEVKRRDAADALEWRPERSPLSCRHSGGTAEGGGGAGCIDAACLSVWGLRGAPTPPPPCKEREGGGGGGGGGQVDMLL